ncbi:MAG: peptidase S15, partial [Alphaproteobacteria bacterium]|nr:peptidase S15 [Alphaproteobacteria bacterium]
AEGSRPLTLSLSPGRLGKAGQGLVTVSSPQTTGLAAGKWCPYGIWADQPLDQRQEMGGQAIFETEPLAEDVDMLGTPLISFDVTSDKTVALIAATLCEVFPDGAATRVSYGILNLTHRDSHEAPEPLVPGRLYRVNIKLCDIGHRFGKDNRIRLALSNAYWPIVWPSPEAGMLTVHCEASELRLPVREATSLDASLQPLPPPKSAPPLAQTEIEPGHNTWTVHVDAMTGTTMLERVNSDGWRRIDGISLELGTHTDTRYTIHPEDPLSASIETHNVRRYRRGSWDVTMLTDVALTSTASDFLLKGKLQAWENERIVKSEEWSVTIPRDLV